MVTIALGGSCRHLFQLSRIAVEDAVGELLSSYSLMILRPSLLLSCCLRLSFGPPGKSWIMALMNFEKGCKQQSK